MKRAPLWFTHSKAKDHIANYWPWALGFAVGGMYWYAPEPFEQLRVSGLYAIRRPVLRGTQWLEVRDVDPETFALDLPPDQIFGPLPLKKQVKFILQALKEDNELADGYITRLVIDHMDLSLDPAFLGDAFVEAGGAEIMRFAVDDYLDRRPNAKHKFFDADRFLRFISICANNNDLAHELLNKHNGVSLLFKAMNDATNEYARVLGMRALTLFAFQQSDDGRVEREIVEGGYLPKIIMFYRQSTGDPTDTRFITMLLSSALRQYPSQTYSAMVENNIVKAAVNNINISRYKGLPQHVRVIQDLFAAREVWLHGKTGKGGTSATATASLSDEARERKARGWFGYFGSEGPKSTDEAPTAARAATPNVAAVEVSPPAPVAVPKVDVAFESHRENPNDIKPLPPPADLKAPVERLLVDADFIPVALGVIDVFPEYFEACRELIHLIDATKHLMTPFDLFEHRFFAVAIKFFNRHGVDADFEAHGVGERLSNIAQWILDDPECKAYLDPNSASTNAEIKMSVKVIKQLLEDRKKRIAEGQQVSMKYMPIPTG